MSFRVVASQRRRCDALGLAPGMLERVPDFQYAMLEMIGRSRRTGAMQKELAKRVNLPPKNCFHHIKHLEQTLGLIVKKSVLDMSVTPSSPTNLIHLKRFAPDPAADLPAPKKAGRKSKQAAKAEEAEEEQKEEGGPDVLSPMFDYAALMEEICKLLADAKDHVLMASNLKEFLGLKGRRHRTAGGTSAKTGARWRTVRRRLIEGGYVVEFCGNVMAENSTVVVADCLRLLKPFSRSASGRAEEAESDQESDDDEGVFVLERSVRVRDALLALVAIRLTAVASLTTSCTGRSRTQVPRASTRPTSSASRACRARCSSARSTCWPTTTAWSGCRTSRPPGASRP